MHDARASFCKKLELLVICLHCMNRDKLLAKKPQLMKSFNRTDAILFERALNFRLGFVHMHMDMGVVFLGELPNFNKSGIVNRIGGVRADSHAHFGIIFKTFKKFFSAGDIFVGRFCHG